MAAGKDKTRSFVSLFGFYVFPTPDQVKGTKKGKKGKKGKKDQST